MIERITKNEERLDNAVSCIKEMEITLEKLKKNRKEINLLNKYYGSKNWFKDKELLEAKQINVKAGVLSEDAVWNMNEDLKYLIKEMKIIINLFK